MTQILVQEQKSNFVLFNTREFSRAPSIDESTLYISSIWSVHTLYLVYSKYYKLYI